MRETIDQSQNVAPREFSACESKQQLPLPVGAGGRPPEKDAPPFVCGWLRCAGKKVYHNVSWQSGC